MLQIKQIIIKPPETSAVVQFSDLAGRSGAVVHGGLNAQSVSALFTECEQKLPVPAELPDKEEVELEIEVLTQRLGELRKAIGAL